MKLLVAARPKTATSLASANVLTDLACGGRTNAPPGISIDVYEQPGSDQRPHRPAGQQWLSAACPGVVLLYLFLPGRVALWVAVGIPTLSFAALGYSG